MRRRGPAPVIMFRRRGMGDALLDAQNALTAAGYTGASCRTERVSFPMADPTTGRNYYDQNVCSADGHTGGFMADVINRGGVNLRAERDQLIRSGGGSQTSYFDGVGAGSQVVRYAGVGVPINAYDPLPPNRELNGGGGGGSAARAVSVSLENTSRPGVGLRVGDAWTLRVSGSPNSAVTGAARQDGRDMGSTGYGSTDSQGLLVIRGTMGAEHVGTWVEKWTVNGMTADLTFTVQPAATSGGSGGVGCPQVLKTCADGSTVGYDPAIKDRCVYLPCPEKTGDFDFSALASNPYVWVAAAAGVGFLFLGGRR